jgi:hypothetical protein
LNAVNEWQVAQMDKNAYRTVVEKSLGGLKKQDDNVHTGMLKFGVYIFSKYINSSVFCISHSCSLIAKTNYFCKGNQSL